MVGALAIIYLVGRLAMLLVHVHVPAGALAAPGALHYAGEQTALAWGGVKSVGLDLFGAGMFPFEAISILLLVAVVGAIAIARPLHEDAVPTDPNNPNDPAVEGHSV